MPRSSVRKSKQQRAQHAPRPTRIAQPEAPADEDAGVAVEEVDEDFSGEVVVEVDDGEDGEPRAAVPVRRWGRVRTATVRRSRVPRLLNEAMDAQMEVSRAQRALEKKVKSARDHGARWEEIGLALRMSRQGAAKRFG